MLGDLASLAAHELGAVTLRAAVERAGIRGEDIGEVLLGNCLMAGQGLDPIARIVAHSTHAHEPEWFSTAPVSAIRQVLTKAGWSAGDVDLWEVNEAFAVVTLVAMQELDLPHDWVNVHGGACALGHPIGASGARCDDVADDRERPFLHLNRGQGRHR